MNGKFEYPTLIYPHLFVGRGVNHIEVMECKF